MFHGSLTVELRGAITEVVYRRLIDGDVEWQFAMDRLNDLRLTARERQDIRREVLGEHWSMTWEDAVGWCVIALVLCAEPIINWIVP